MNCLNFASCKVYNLPGLTFRVKWLFIWAISALNYYCRNRDHKRKPPPLWNKIEWNVSSSYCCCCWTEITHFVYWKSISYFQHYMRTCLVMIRFLHNIHDIRDSCRYISDGTCNIIMVATFEREFHVRRTEMRKWKNQLTICWQCSELCLLAGMRTARMLIGVIVHYIYT